MVDKTPYQILGLPENATFTDAEKAWKKSVREMHPDKHPEDKRDHFTEKLAEVNEAWKSINNGWKPLTEKNNDDLEGRIQKGSEIPLFYSYRDPNIQKIIDKIQKKDSKETFTYFCKNLISFLLKGSLPKKNELHISLCAAVIIENKILTYIFHAPLPPTRCILIIPEIRKTHNGVNVLPNKPKVLSLTLKSKLSGVITPFSKQKIEDLDLDTIQISLPSRNFDIKKNFTLKPKTFRDKIIYKKIIY